MVQTSRRFAKLPRQQQMELREAVLLLRFLSNSTNSTAALK